MSERRLPPTVWGRHRLEWGARTHVMAIVNVTPDSFSGDGTSADLTAAVAMGEAAVAAGADLIDLGAESTRPGHRPVSPEEELARLLPVLTALRPRVTVPISIDTSKAAVAAAALAAGADLINDVRGLAADPDLAGVIAAAAVPVVIMHDQVPEPGRDLAASIVDGLQRRVDAAVVAGIAWERIIVDPGFGFGKTWRQGLELLRRLPELARLERPVLAGTSRKSMIGRVLGVPPADRLEGTAATVALAIAGGADIVRVHDVRAMARVAAMTDAVVHEAPVAAATWPGAPAAPETTA